MRAIVGVDVGGTFTDVVGVSASGVTRGKVPSTPSNPAEGVVAAVSAAVEEANAGLSRVEQIKTFRILPVDWLPGGDELTPTMKLKRRPIREKYAAEIDALYGGG